MNCKFILFFLCIFLYSCENKSSKIKHTNNFELYSNNGFALIYNDKLYKNRIVSKKIDERSLIVFNNKLRKDTVVKITNLLNGKDLIAKIGKNSKYPIFYNSVISDRIAKDLDIDKYEPYIKIQTVISNNSFIINKAKTFDEEKKVANKAPVKNISIKNLGIVEKIDKKSDIKKISNFSYIIKFADLFFEDSAFLLKKRLNLEFNIKNVFIKKISDNKYRVYKGPYKNLESMKKEFNNIRNLNFENIEIIKL